MSRRSLTIIAALLLWATGSDAAEAPRCAVPDDMLYTEQAMPRVARKLAANQPLRIVADSFLCGERKVVAHFED